MIRLLEQFALLRIDLDSTLLTDSIVDDSEVALVNIVVDFVIWKAVIEGMELETTAFSIWRLSLVLVHKLLDLGSQVDIEP
jgi:hypothetical protein